MSRWLVRDARIVNGDGASPPVAGDVLVDGDVIVRMGSVPRSDAASADRVVEAKGRVIAPGFVDTHNHGALGGTAPGESGLPRACELAILGGVTKRICGVDGLSPAPVVEAQRSQYAAQLRPLDGAIDGPWSWSSVAEFLAWHRGRSVTDMGLYLGHSAVRRVVMENLARVASDGEVAAMAEVVRREAPATLGLSTGLVYNPAVYSDQRELTALVRAFNQVKPGALFPHLRSESDAIVGSLKEVLEAAIDGGGAYCNEHSKIAGATNYDRIGELEDMLADAAASIPTMENMYPYTAGSTTGDAIFPPEARAGARAEFLARLDDPEWRRRIADRMRHDTTSWDNFVHFCGGPAGDPDRRREGRGGRLLARQAARRRGAGGRRDRPRLRSRPSRRCSTSSSRTRARSPSSPTTGTRPRWSDSSAAPPWPSAPTASCPGRGRSRTPAPSAPSRRRCAWPGRWAFPSSRWCGGCRRSRAASCGCPTPRCARAPTRRSCSSTRSGCGSGTTTRRRSSGPTGSTWSGSTARRCSTTVDSSSPGSSPAARSTSPRAA